MSSPSFHRFSRLPVELRLLIWESCCFIRSERHNHSQSETASTLCQQQSEWNSVPGRSPLFIKEGLWGACTESKSVFKKHIERQDYMIIESASGTDNNGLPIDYVLCPNEHYLHRQACSIPDRKFDQCCIREASWEKFKDIRIMSGRTDIVFSPVPNVVRGSDIRFSRVAFEFDASWNDNLPDRLRQLSEEESPRGALTRAYEHFVSLKHLDGPNIYIIDKNVKWCRKGAYSDDSSWSDCDSEYIPVHRYKISHLSVDGVSGSARVFLTYFRRLALWWKHWPVLSCTVLVRRDNEVDGCGDDCGKGRGCFIPVGFEPRFYSPRLFA